MPCLCRICKGNLISRYLRRKHAKLYSGGIEETVGASANANIESVDYKSQCLQMEMLVELPKSVDSSYCEDVETLNSFDEDPEVLIIFCMRLVFSGLWLITY